MGEDRALVRAMTARLSHRGPDDDGFFFTPEAALGFRRLSIVDVAHGRQPVFGAAGTAAVCNGEIYNHERQRAALAAGGRRFASASDAEVVPHLYELHGPGFVGRLQGKFALAVLDTEGRRLLLARDRLGIKPLYTLSTEAGFFFASEIKSLLLAPGFVPIVDREGLDRLLTFKHIPGEGTLLEGVRLLAPGHMLTVDLATLASAETPYYALPVEPSDPPFPQAAAEVRRRLDRAVERRLMSDVPIGVALSGGLDSSAVVASVALQTDRPPGTYSVHVGEDFDEMPYARMVAERYRTDHHEFRVEPEEIDAVVPTVLWHLEEPLSISEIPTYYLGREVGKHVKVLLCGEGADELFGGYKRFLPLHAAPRLPRDVLAWGYVRGLNGITHRQRRALAAGPQLPFVGPNTNQALDAALAWPGARLDGLLRYELRHQLRSQVLRLDKLTMAHGVEARCPFLDPELVDYVVGLPARFKVRGRNEKVLLKAAMAERLPEPVVERRKHGFRNPVVRLFRGPFRDVCRETFRERRDVLAPYFDPTALNRLLASVKPRPGRLRLPEMQLFHVYLFLRWHEIFVDGVAVPPASVVEPTEPRRSAMGTAS